MRKIFRVLGGLCVCVLVAGCAFFLYLLYRSPVLEGGTMHTYYTEANSSARAVVSSSPLAKFSLGRVKGESAVYEGDRLAEFAEKFDAKFLFSEEACGKTSYYLYSPALGEGVALGGRTVNLQIVCGGGQTAVGVPLIFGGW